MWEVWFSDQLEPTVNRLSCATRTIRLSVGNGFSFLRSATNNTAHGGINSRALCIVDIFVVHNPKLNHLLQHSQDRVLHVLSLSAIRQ